MQGANRTFLAVLHVPHAEVWIVKNKEGSCLARDNLEVLYNKSLNTIILKVHDVKISFEKLTQVVAAVGEKSKYRAYLFAHPDGFQVLKIYDTEPSVAVENFETILQNNTQFVRKSGLEHRLDGLTHSSGSHKLTAKSVDNTHPNQRLVRTYDELINVESAGVHVVDIPADWVKNLKDEAEEIIRNHQDLDHWKEYTRWGGIEGDTLTTGHTLPAEVNSTTKLGSKLDELNIGDKDLKIPSTHVNPALGTHVPVDATISASVDIGTTL